MKTYIIHYTKLKDRKSNILSFLSCSNYDYEFIEEYDKENITEKDLKKFFSKDQEIFHQKITPLWGYVPYREINLAEISCTIKHVVSLGKIASQEEEYGLILEDDAIPIENNFIEKIEEIIRISPRDWDSIFLGAGCGIDFMNQKINEEKYEVVNNNFVKAKHPTTNCAEAYLVKKESAKKIYDSIIPFNITSDWELAYQFYKFDMNVYWSIPPLFYQGSKSGQYNSTLR